LEGKCEYRRGETKIKEVLMHRRIMVLAVTVFAFVWVISSCHGEFGPEKADIGEPGGWELPSGEEGVEEPGEVSEPTMPSEGQAPAEEQPVVKCALCGMIRADVDGAVIVNTMEKEFLKSFVQDNAKPVDWNKVKALFDWDVDSVAMAIKKDNPGMGKEPVFFIKFSSDIDAPTQTSLAALVNDIDLRLVNVDYDGDGVFEGDLFAAHEDDPLLSLNVEDYLVMEGSSETPLRCLEGVTETKGLMACAYVGPEVIKEIDDPIKPDDLVDYYALHGDIDKAKAWGYLYKDDDAVRLVAKLLDEDEVSAMNVMMMNREKALYKSLVDAIFQKLP
jgi:hypothetical protein